MSNWRIKEFFSAKHGKVLYIPQWKGLTARNG